MMVKPECRKNKPAVTYALPEPVRSIRMEVRRNRGDVHAVRHVLMDAISTMNISEERYTAFELAVGEGLANAVTHGTGDIVKISCKLNNSAVMVTISNQGKAFVPNPALPPPDAPSGRGMGLMLMCADDVDIAAHGGWIVLRLHLRRR